MKHFNALANREFLVFVAIVASAITLHVRHIDSGAPSAPSHIQYGRMCEPSESSSGDDSARVRPADCDMRTNVRTHRILQPWV